jgi:hypothetical protein
MFRVSDGGSSIDDCERFLDPNASWAAKAADLGWDAGLAEAGSGPLGHGERNALGLSPEAER